MFENRIPRRRFLAATGALGTAGLIGATGDGPSARAAAAAGPVERKDVRDLTSDEVDLLREAFKRLQDRPASDRTSYRHQAGIHSDHCPHGNWWFLPWHRAYLFYFERLLQDAVKDLSPPKPPTVPYWDWTDQREIPAPFRGTYPANRLANNTRYSPLQLRADRVGDQVMRRVVDQANTFISFGSNRANHAQKRLDRGKSGFESLPHDHVHARVSNDMDDPPTAAGDPLFWSHHSNIDRWWVYWLGLPGHKNPQESNANDRPWFTLTLREFVDTNGSPLTRTVKQIMEDPVIQAVVYVPFSGRTRTAVVGVPVKPARNGASAEEPEAVEVPAVLPAGQQAVFKRKQALTMTVPVSEPLRRRLQELFAAKPVRGSVLLRVHGLRLPQKPPPAEVRVFLNHPEADEKTSGEDPHFVGELPLFDFAGGHGAEAQKTEGHGQAGASRLVDLTWVLQMQIASKEGGLGGQLQVTFVLAPQEPEKPPRPEAVPVPADLAVPFRGATLFLEE